MFEPYKLRDEIALPDGSAALGWFVVFAASEQAAHVTARIHLAFNCRVLGLLP